MWSVKVRSEGVCTGNIGRSVLITSLANVKRSRDIECVERRGPNSVKTRLTNTILQRSEIVGF